MPFELFKKKEKKKVENKKEEPITKNEERASETKEKDLPPPEVKPTDVPQVLNSNQDDETKGCETVDSENQETSTEAVTGGDETEEPVLEESTNTKLEKVQEITGGKGETDEPLKDNAEIITKEESAEVSKSNGTVNTDKEPLKLEKVYHDEGSMGVVCCAIL